MDWDSSYIDALVRAELEVDARDASVPTVSPDDRRHACIVARQSLVCAGLPLACRVFRALDPNARIELLIAEGQSVTTL